MPQQLFGEVDGENRIVICDMEAGVGPIARQGRADLVVVVAEPSVKSIDVACRAAGAATSAGAEVIVVANRVRGDADLERIRAELGDHELVVVPEEPAIAEADEQGLAPVDAAPSSPGVVALSSLADRLGKQPAPA